MGDPEVLVVDLVLGSGESKPKAVAVACVANMDAMLLTVGEQTSEDVSTLTHVFAVNSWRTSDLKQGRARASVATVSVSLAGRVGGDLMCSRET